MATSLSVEASGSQQMSTSLQLPSYVGVKRSPSPALNLSYSPGSTPSNSQTTHPDSGPPAPKRKRQFHRELKKMMHGFGDDSNPFTETVDLVEDLAIEFITEMTLRAMEVGKSGRVHVNDIKYLVRKDPKKYARVTDLLTMNEELKRARKEFDDPVEDEGVT